jgi:hypothetical protein
MDENNNVFVEDILNPKLTREKYIELRNKGNRKSQIALQWGISNIYSLINLWNLKDWVPGQPVPDRKKQTRNKDSNKDAVLIETQHNGDQTQQSEAETQYNDQLPDVTNMVEHPPHYTAGGVECIDAIMAAVTGLSPQEAVCVANVIKYTWRFKHKNGKQDLQKAEWYIKRLIELQGG